MTVRNTLITGYIEKYGSLFFVSDKKLGHWSICWHFCERTSEHWKVREGTILNGPSDCWVWKKEQFWKVHYRKLWRSVFFSCPLDFISWIWALGYVYYIVDIKDWCQKFRGNKILDCYHPHLGEGKTAWLQSFSWLPNAWYKTETHPFSILGVAF